jgi:hypothetical protein
LPNRAQKKTGAWNKLEVENVGWKKLEKGENL